MTTKDNLKVFGEDRTVQHPNCSNNVTESLQTLKSQYCIPIKIIRILMIIIKNV